MSASTHGSSPGSAAARPVRVRIAPSPTGDPHIGTAYMGLFNAAFARKHGGTFVVRIEDTDQKRFRQDSEDQILSSLKWVGLTWQEGPDVGGPHAPYRQSERLEIYKKHAHNLLGAGHAYRCFCTSERLDTVRRQHQEQKIQGGYDRHCRGLADADVKKLLDAGTAHTIRMKYPLGGKTSFVDEMRGVIEFDNEGIDDQVLLKSDGFPTYHLAVVVDDHLMEITHVIRGEEWITSTPKHVTLYDMFGWPRPVFAHMPLLRNVDKSKISKRKNPTSIGYYRRKGILPEALRNFLALMGFALGDREVFTFEEMAEHLSLSNVHLGGPVFDLQKLAWLNGQYLKALSDDAWVKHLRDEVYGEAALRAIVPLIKERIEKFEDFEHATSFFFAGDLPLDASHAALMTPKGRTPAEAADMLAEALDALEAEDEWKTQALHDALERFLAKKGAKPKDVFMPLRIAATGRKDSPPLFETLEVLGKEIVRRRVRLAIDLLKKETKAAP